VQATALTTREHAHLLLLVAAVEVEAPAVGAAGHLELADVDDVQAAGDVFPDGLVVGQSSRCWSTKAIFTVEPMTTSPLSGCSLPAISLNSVDLPAPLGPMMPTMAPQER
jgi:hypothetical protein